MFMNAYVSAEVGRQRQREMLALWGARTRPLVLTVAFMRPARIR